MFYKKNTIHATNGRASLTKHLRWILPLGIMGWLGSGFVAMYLRYVRQPNLMYPEPPMDVTPYFNPGGVAQRDGSNLARSMKAVFMGPIALAQETGLRVSNSFEENFASFFRSIYDGIESTLGRLSAKKVCEDEVGIMFKGDGWGLITEEYAFVEVRDDTGVHRLRVPPWIVMPKAGIAWTFQMDVSEYQPSMET